jgi:flagellar basal-body rod protein FlgC
MSMFGIFDVAASGMSAQSTRLNTVASNLANANSVSGDPNLVYRARQPVFEAMFDRLRGDPAQAGVRTLGVVEKAGAPEPQYDPGNPLANAEGYVFHANVDPVEELANMMSASRGFQNNVEVLNTVKQLMLSTIRIGQ